jgi:hypothetical protein
MFTNRLNYALTSRCHSPGVNLGPSEIIAPFGKGAWTSDLCTQAPVLPRLIHGDAGIGCTFAHRMASDPSNSETEFESTCKPKRAERRDDRYRAAALFVVVGASPKGEANGLVRELMKNLLDEFRTSQPMVSQRALPLRSVTGAMPHGIGA